MRATTRHKRTFHIRDRRVTVTVQGKKTTYQFNVFDVDPEVGEAGVNLRKLDGEAYDVLVGPMPSCECLGFLRWGKCKHLDIGRVLVDRNRGQ